MLWDKESGLNVTLNVQTRVCVCVFFLIVSRVRGSPWRNTRRGGTLCCLPRSSRRRETAPRRNTGFYGPGRAWRGDTGSGSKSVNTTR